MKKTVQTTTNRNKPGATKTEMAKAERAYRAGDITKAELGAVKRGERGMLTLDGDVVALARKIGKPRGMTASAVIESAVRAHMLRAKNAKTAYSR